VIAKLLVPPVLVASGISTGILAWSLLAGIPLIMTVPTDEYHRSDLRFLNTRFDKVQPACIVLTVVIDAILAAGAVSGFARIIFAAAGLCALGILVVSLTRSVPIKKQMAAPNPATLDRGTDLRLSWNYWNHYRTAFAILALMANAIAVVFVW
jgi:hypothetical protein